MNDISSELLRETRPLVTHLYTRRPWIYWCDFLGCLIVGYGCAAHYLLTPWQKGLGWENGLTCLALLLSASLLYRVSLFIHEIVHFHHGEMRAFQITWNLLAGIPMLIPSFFYEPHHAHHLSRTYGTNHDGEYLPLVSGGWRGIVKFLGEIFVLPVYYVIRFLIGTPASFFSPRLRNYLLERHSSFVIDLSYHRDVDPNAPRRLWGWIEFACFLRIVFLLASIAVGVAPWTRIPKLFVLGFLILGANHLRTLTAHHYRNRNAVMSHGDQFLDSTNIEGNPLTELLCPLGLRFHALHHLLPRLPYHNLKTAHRLLTRELPADSPYHRVTYRSCLEVVLELIRNVRDAHPSQSTTDETLETSPN